MKQLSAAVFFLLVCFYLLICCSAAYAAPRVYFKNLKNGDKVHSPVKVEIGLDGMSLAKAGSLGEAEGHHHILVNKGPIEKGQPIPADEAHLHFGQLQSEAVVILPPGKHTLTLQFADGLHRSFGKDLSATVEIEVLPGS